MMDTDIPVENNRTEVENKEPSLHQESLGSFLRRERLKKGLNLQEIADGTCISITTLRVLEEDDTNRMPADVFVRGFLRLYAEQVGIDSGVVLKMYARSKRESGQGGQEDQTEANDRKGVPDRTLSDRFGKIIVFIILLAVLGLLAFYLVDPSFRHSFFNG